MRKGLLNQMMSVAKRGVALLFFVCLVAQHCIVSEATNSKEGTETAVEVAESNDDSAQGTAEPTILYEMEEKRDERTKHFAMSDGSVKAYIYPQTVHYLEDEKYEEIDNLYI